jgi:hypothetical protein
LRIKLWPLNVRSNTPFGRTIRAGRRSSSKTCSTKQPDPEAELEEGDEPQFLVTVIPYADRNDIGAVGEELTPRSGPT